MTFSKLETIVGLLNVYFNGQIIEGTLSDPEAVLAPSANQFD